MWSIDQQHRHGLGACWKGSISGPIPDQLNQNLNFTASAGGLYAIKLFMCVYSEKALSPCLFFLQVPLLHKYTPRHAHTHTHTHTHTQIATITSFVFLPNISFCLYRQVQRYAYFPPFPTNVCLLLIAVMNLAFLTY